LEFSVFLKEISEKNPYETGDSDVDALVDLLKHRPAVGGMLGVGKQEESRYISQIDQLIKLER